MAEIMRDCLSILNGECSVCNGRCPQYHSTVPSPPKWTKGKAEEAAYRKLFTDVADYIHEHYVDSRSCPEALGAQSADEYSSYHLTIMHDCVHYGEDCGICHGKCEDYKAKYKPTRSEEDAQTYAGQTKKEFARENLTPSQAIAKQQPEYIVANPVGGWYYVQKPQAQILHDLFGYKLSEKDGHAAFKDKETTAQKLAKHGYGLRIISGAKLLADFPPPNLKLTVMYSPNAIQPKRMDLTEELMDLDEGFSRTLLKLIDSSGKKDSEVYTAAHVDRRLFSHIRNNPDYRPTKPIAIAFAVALELDLDETCDLIARAGYALSTSIVFDVIIKYFISMKKYDIVEINETLFAFDQHLLGSS